MLLRDLRAFYLKERNVYANRPATFLEQKALVKGVTPHRQSNRIRSGAAPGVAVDRPRPKRSSLA